MPHALTEDDHRNLGAVRQRLSGIARNRTQLIPILQMIMALCRFVPVEAMEMAATHLGIPISEIYGVATFYNQFRFTPPGRHPIKVCLGTACHVRGGDIILENFERRLGIVEGETTADREYSLERVACVGCCALAPVALVGDAVHGHMAPSKTEGLVLRHQIEKEKAEREDRRDDADTA
ncbi:MAG: NAD(P)H-dependent oxidoreductase subunit E [Pseudomonadota bacterium]